MLISQVRHFGGKISSRLSNFGDVPAALPDIALEELGRSDIIEQLTYTKIAEAVAGEQSLPRQYGAAGALGDPPVTLFLDVEKRFYIEALLHSAVSTSIHDHSFSGAFAVVSGNCAHQVFDYETDDTSGDLAVGVLTERQNEALHAGISRPIRNGSGLIHRNLHLDRPTVTIVIRTVWDGCRQHTYHQPGLALDSQLSQTERKQLQLLAGLHKVDAAAAASFIRQLLRGRPTAGQAFRCLDYYLRASGQWDELEALVELGRPVLGSRGPLVADALRQATAPEPSLVRLLSQFQDRESPVRAR